MPHSGIYDIKFELNDNNFDYETLLPFQLYNHFQGHGELTTKAGLTKNLSYEGDHTFRARRLKQKLLLAEMTCDHFFPRSYDISQHRSLQDFIEDFERTAIFCIVKKHALYFRENHKATLKAIHAELEGATSPDLRRRAEAKWRATKLEFSLYPWKTDFEKL